MLTGLINVMFASVFHVFRENGYREKAKGDKYDAFTFMVVDMLKFSEFCEFKGPSKKELYLFIFKHSY